MLPTDRPLTPADLKQVARDVKEWMDENGIKLSTIEHALGDGFSKTTVSAFLKGTYTGDREKVARGLNAWMEQQVQRAEIAVPHGFIPFNVAKRMLGVAKHACDRCKIGLVVGPSGCGKSMCAEAMNRMRPGSLLYPVVDQERSPNGFIKELATMLGVPTHRSTPQVFRAVIAKLKGSGRLLIIDEAHRLNARSMQVVRDLHDNAKIPIVLFATDEILELIDDTTTNLGQMSSRVSIRYNVVEDMQGGAMPGPGGQRRREFCWSAREIEQRFANEQVRLTGDAIDFLFLVANALGYGCLRLAGNLVEKAVDYALLKSLKEIDRALLLECLRQLHGETYVGCVSERSEQLGRQRIALSA